MIEAVLTKVVGAVYEAAPQEQPPFLGTSMALSAYNLPNELQDHM